MRNTLFILFRYIVFALLAFGSSQIFGFSLGLMMTGDNPGALLGFYAAFVLSFLFLLGLEFLFLYGKILFQNDRLWMRGLKFFAYGFGTVLVFIIFEQLSQQFAQGIFASSIIAFTFLSFTPAHAAYIGLLIFFLTAGRLLERRMTRLYLMRIK